jgi:hypothetical protein
MQLSYLTMDFSGLVGQPQLKKWIQGKLGAADLGVSAFGVG